jgi:hypothetical protein
MLYGMKRPREEEHREKRTELDYSDMYPEVDEKIYVPSSRRFADIKGAHTSLTQKNVHNKSRDKFLAAVRRGHLTDMRGILGDYMQAGGCQSDLINARDLHDRTITMTILASDHIWPQKKFAMHKYCMLNDQSMLESDENGANELHYLARYVFVKSNKYDQWATFTWESFIDPKINPLLKEKMANVGKELANQPDLNGDTPLDYAYRYGNGYGFKMLRTTLNAKTKRELAEEAKQAYDARSAEYQWSAAPKSITL